MKKEYLKPEIVTQKEVGKELQEKASEKSIAELLDIIGKLNAKAPESEGITYRDELNGTEITLSLNRGDFPFAYLAVEPVDEQGIVIEDKVEYYSVYYDRSKITREFIPYPTQEDGGQSIMQSIENLDAQEATGANIVTEREALKLIIYVKKFLDKEPFKH